MPWELHAYLGNGKNTDFKFYPQTLMNIKFIKKNIKRAAVAEFKNF